eukprot:TRINITY_DN16190_c0_g1_i2.p1 TRINITY_DN16190_c0_g1~~TRINITY_DN16190_c0_g1_i2.p1  ORF type:complete len:322 (+),score=68.02 TRINITY_DN16190_c0_g1_i2:135-1100(+)
MEEKKKLGKYEIIRRSETGSVFFGADDETKVVIKEFEADKDSSGDENWLPNVAGEKLLVPLEVIKEPPYVYVAYASGGEITLAEYVKLKGRLKENEIIKIMKDVLSGYEELIRSGVVYKNIGPQNIMLDRQDALRTSLFGFGIEEKISHNNGNCSAPEALFNAEPPTPASDIWSIGALVYFMLNASSLPKGNEYSVSLDIGHYCLDFMKICLRSEPSERASLKALKFHPLLQPKERKLVKNKSFPIDKYYTCNCGFKHDVILSCKHSFCVDCIANKKRTSHLDNKGAFSSLVECAYCFVCYGISKSYGSCRCNSVELWVRY